MSRRDLLPAEGVAKMEELNMDSDEELNDVVEVTGMEEEPGSAEESDVEEAEEAAAGAKRKRKCEAAIWASGAAKKVNDRAVCMICKKDYAITGGNTSVIRSHVQNPSPKHNK